jgi:6-pyruvoyltetrahydropterin/6-carboxytetrahydropterin synthase
MPRLSTIELFKENMKFSAGHFTIFSSESRENLHGHNYNVYVSYTLLIEDQGLSFDYRLYKEKLRHLCRSLNETILIPEKSPYLKIEEAGDYYYVHFNNEKIIFLKRDMKLLPVSNITVEELSNYLLSKITEEKTELEINKIQKVKVKVFSGPGQCASALWRSKNV